MAEVRKEYDARTDSRGRLTLRGATFDHYHVREYEDGTIELAPRELVDPRISERTLEMMDRAVERVDDGEVGEEFDLDGLDELDASGE